MLEGIQKNIVKLTALYEAEKQRADRLEAQLSDSLEENAKSNGQILELKRQIDSLKLRSALGAGKNTAETRESIDRLVAEIDRCIRLLEY